MTTESPQFLELKPSPVHVSTCAKCILVGEHAVGYGAQAVAIPLKSLRMDLSFTRRAEPDFKGFDLVLNGIPLPRHVSLIIEEALDELKLAPAPFVVDGHVNFPLGAGLGSSAALCVAMVKGILSAYGLEKPNAEIIQIAVKLERRFHGNPSGLDVHVVASETPVIFKKNSIPVELQINPNLDWHFALIDSGARAMTKDMVLRAQPHFEGQAGKVLIEQANQLVFRLTHAFENADYAAMKSVLKSANAFLDHIGVLCSEIWDVIEQLESYGIDGAKATGAGGGGMVLALLDESKLNQQKELLAKVFGEDKVLHTALRGSEAKMLFWNAVKKFRADRS